MDMNCLPAAAATAAGHSTARHGTTHSHQTLSLAKDGTFLLQPDSAACHTSELVFLDTDMQTAGCDSYSPLWPVPDPQAPQDRLEPCGAHAKVLGHMCLVIEEHLQDTCKVNRARGASLRAGRQKGMRLRDTNLLSCRACKEPWHHEQQRPSSSATTDTLRLPSQTHTHTHTG